MTTQCSTSTDCIGSAFCNTTSQTCNSCALNCIKCHSETFCLKCDPGKQPNITGACTLTCSGAGNLLQGNYCDNGVLKTCDQNLTSQCYCMTGNNCASCTSDFSKCETCLRGYVLANGNCENCAEKFEKVDSFCVEKVAENIAQPGFPVGAIVGIIIAILMMIGIIIGLTYYFIKKNKAKISTGDEEADFSGKVAAQ